MIFINNKLDLVDLSKKYKGSDSFALDKINLSFTPGIYGILGENGAGKSTLFNIITGLISKSSGHVIFNGEDVENNIENFKGNIGYMPQNQTLYPNFSVKRFLYYMASLKGVEKKKIKEEVNRVLLLTDLSNYENRKISSLSGGMLQRLLISQSLISDPNILILDEPTAGLDPKQRIIIRNFLSKISSEKIVLISTHVVSDIEHISKEIVILKNGRLIIKDRPENILNLFKDKVIESEVEQEDINYFIENYNVSQMQILANGKNYIKLCGDFTEKDDILTYKFKKSEVNLEDVYLYLFEGGN